MADSQRKLSKHEAARKLVKLVEAHMDRKGLSEGKRKERVKQFTEYVDSVAGRAK
jgi:hypothetical protein